jgi:hypothetical protein
MSIDFTDPGIPLTHQKVVPGNTITSLGAEFYSYTERLLPFTSGGTTTIVVGDWIVGATSTAKAEVVSVTLTSGTWAGGTAAGTFQIRSQHGTFESENVLVAAGTNDATIAANSTVAPPGYMFYGMSAQSAIVSVEAQTALVSVTGGKPDQTALVGHQLAAGSSWQLYNRDQIKNFRCVDKTAGSASTLQVTFFF